MAEPPVASSCHANRHQRGRGRRATRAELRVDVFRRMVGSDFTSLPRGDLAAAIYRTVEDTVPTVFNDSITGIDQGPDGVRVTFEDGPTDDFDLVIGAASTTSSSMWSARSGWTAGPTTGCC
ncbi:hypothetical protein [Mycobacterium sp. DL440]|uniref:hypothetical protein n=1 Tax=Mycobacterium sp. DL440 TaxID=2675523 RepID=UPI0035304402